MAQKRYSAEQIVTLLRQIEVIIGQDKSTRMACREAGISEQSFYRWRKEYGWLQVELAKRMMVLEKENARLTRLVADVRPVPRQFHHAFTMQAVVRHHLHIWIRIFLFIDYYLLLSQPKFPAGMPQVNSDFRKNDSVRVLTE